MSLLLGGVFTVFSQERYVKPVDEGKSDASFHAFRAKLISAAEGRDAKYIISIIDPKIMLSFGDSAGMADFKRIWKIEKADSKFWDEFLRVIRNGGSFSVEEGQKKFWAPYTFMPFPDDLDPFDHDAIFGSNVNLREKPSASAAVISSLSYNIVKVDYQNSVKQKNSENEYDWLKVETLGGKRGFVKAEYVRSPIDYRAGFAKKRGAWKMIVFIAGD
ncbi:MAG: SH3 domain-containing protein [Pyrinomonadaceae bacterium]